MRDRPICDTVDNQMSRGAKIVEILVFGYEVGSVHRAPPK